MGNGKGRAGLINNKILRAVPKLELALVSLHCRELIHHILTLQ